MTYYIEGERVRLRPITDTDTALIVKWRNSPHVRNNFIYREDLTEEIHRNWLETKVATGEVVQYIIENKQTGKPIGSVYYSNIDKPNRSGEFGIFIGEEDYCGGGYGTETTKLFVDFGFKQLGLNIISLRVLQSNERAYKTYLAQGFIKSNIISNVINGNPEDVIIMMKYVM